MAKAAAKLGVSTHRWPRSYRRRHMPSTSHIFTRVGYWSESIASNVEAARVAKADKEARKSPAPLICSTGSTPLRHRANTAPVKMDTIVDILDVGEGKEMVQSVWRVGLAQLDLVIFHAINDADVSPVVAHDLHVLLDLVNSHHGAPPCSVSG